LRELAPDAEIHFERLAVTLEQIAHLNLPLRPTKHSDSRAARFEAEYGQGSVELDAIHPDALRAIVREAIERHVDFASSRCCKKPKRASGKSSKCSRRIAEIANVRRPGDAAHGFPFGTGIAFSMARRMNFTGDTPRGSPLVL
jgi:hypothetical protein